MQFAIFLNYFNLLLDGSQSSQSFSLLPNVQLLSTSLKNFCLFVQTFEQIKRNQIERFNKAETDEERNAIIFDPLIIFHKAIENTKPIMKLLKIKRGGQTYQVCLSFHFL